MRWYALRLQDGGGELAGLVPLVAGIWFALRDRTELERTARGAWVGISLLLIQAAAYPFLPAMIRAMLILGTLASVFGIWRKPGILCLIVLALPWTASLDFFLGYPLRMLTSINARFFLETVGVDVAREGVRLLHDGDVVGVDPACSGMNMLWSTGLLVALLAAVLSLRWRSLIVLGAVALAIALVGNSLRAAILFFPEAGLVNMPHLLHPGIGIGIAGGGFLVLIKLARWLSAKGAPAPAGVPTHRPTADLCIVIASLLVVFVSSFSKIVIQRTSETPPLLTNFQGIPVTRIPLTTAEEKFYEEFPGSIAVYEADGFKLIVRQVSRATRKLHPASHCLRAEGFRIGEKTVEGSEDGGRWLSYMIVRDGERFQVRERITNTASQECWPEISAWYWHAFLHPGKGPWEAVTVISG